MLILKNIIKKMEHFKINYDLLRIIFIFMISMCVIERGEKKNGNGEIKKLSKFRNLNTWISYSIEEKILKDI